MIEALEATAQAEYGAVGGRGDAEAEGHFIRRGEAAPPPRLPRAQHEPRIAAVEHHVQLVGAGALEQRLEFAARQPTILQFEKAFAVGDVTVAREDEVAAGSMAQCALR